MLLPITTGLSIALMDSLDAYRTTGTKTIANFQFPEDVELALRQELSKAIDSTVAAVAVNPRPAASAQVENVLRIPQVIPANQEVLGFEVPAEAPPSSGVFSA